MADPISLSIIATLGVTSTALSNVLYLGISAAIYAGASLGLSALASFFTPKPQTPRPEDVQQSTKQPLSPRYRHYGRVKTTGSWVFAGAKGGSFHKVLAIGQGPIDAIEEYWVDDLETTLDAGGNGHIGESVRIRTRLGNASEAYYDELAAVFPEWTASHQGNGIVSLYAMQKAVESQYYLRFFPNGVGTNYRLVIRGCLVENPYTQVIEWSDNPSSIIKDYLVHQDGLRLPESIINTPLAITGWQTAFAKSGTPSPLKGGGTEERYRLWGSYSLEERPADVLNRMLVSCDGRLQITPDGGLTLDIGDIPSNLVTLDSSTINAFQDVGRGRDILTTANTIRATFIDPNQDYQSADADPWVDTDDVDIRGEITQDVDFIMSPSHSQARRLMKLAAYRANPSWVGTFTCNLKALAAFGERFVIIDFPSLGINEIFEVQDFRFNMGENGILTNVTIQVASLPSAAYSWNAVLEEGTAPISADVDQTSVIPDVTDFNVSIQRKTINDQQYPYALLTFDAPPSPALKTQAQGKLVSDSTWTPIAVSDGATSAESFLLADGGQYEFQVRHVSLEYGAWSSSIVITAVADVTPPGIITALVVTGGLAKVDTSWQSPNSPNFAATNIYRNSVNNLGTATLIRTEYGAANFPFIYTNQPLAAGTYYYWFRARNASGVEGTAVASGPIVVT